MQIRYRVDTTFGTEHTNNMIGDAIADKMFDLTLWHRDGDQCVSIVELQIVRLFAFVFLRS